MSIETTEKVERDFYVIAIDWTSYPYTAKEGHQKVVHTIYFKADRYSVYSGRLQTERHVTDGKPFKTADGAQKAIDRYLARGLFKREYNPRVVRYTETRTVRVETLSRSPEEAVR